MAKQTSYSLLLATLIVIMVLTTGIGHGKEKDGITISCYIGDPSDNRRVGEVEVFDIDKGPGNCNALYNRCEGGCTACFREVGGREMCMDRSGGMYYRWGFP